MWLEQTWRAQNQMANRKNPVFQQKQHEPLLWVSDGRVSVVLPPLWYFQCFCGSVLGRCWSHLHLSAVYFAFRFPGLEHLHCKHCRAVLICF